MNVPEICQATTRKKGGGRPDVQTPCTKVIWGSGLLSKGIDPMNVLEICQASAREPCTISRGASNGETDKVIR